MQEGWVGVASIGCNLSLSAFQLYATRVDTDLRYLQHVREKNILAPRQEPVWVMLPVVCRRAIAPARFVALPPHQEGLS